MDAKGQKAATKAATTNPEEDAFRISAGKRLSIKRYKERSATTRRLMELGLLPGTRVRVVRTAPLGDPVELEVRGYSLSLRKSELALMELSS